MNSQESLIPVVDENDTIVWYKKRELISNTDIYRVSAAIIKNEKGEILLAQRGLQKKNSPGQWNVSVAWTVEKWETYEQNIEKEVREELWIDEVTLTLLGKRRIKKERNYFTQFYIWSISSETKLTIEYPEVNDIKWVNKQKLEEMVKNPEINISTTVTSLIQEYKLLN